MQGFHYREIVSKRVKLLETPKDKTTTTELEMVNVNVAKAEKMSYMT